MKRNKPDCGSTADVVPDMIRTEAELSALYACPASASIRKVKPQLTATYRKLIEASPFLVISTVGPRGIDCSPRGDAPGFVRIKDDRTLLLPERRGNNRVDTLKNLIGDPRASLLFLIPGIPEMLRLNGEAFLSSNSELCEAFCVNGSAPKIVLVFKIRQVMFQCARAAVRSHLWNPASFRSPQDLPTAGAMLADATGGQEGGPAYDQALPERIRNSLY